MGAVLTRLLEIFYTKKLDIVVIGLENRCVTMWCFWTKECIESSCLGSEVSTSKGQATQLSLSALSLSDCSGKTTLLSVLAHGEPVETVPTIGLNVKVFKKGKVNMKCWDIGTFPAFCSSRCAIEVVFAGGGRVHLIRCKNLARGSEGWDSKQNKPHGNLHPL